MRGYGRSRLQFIRPSITIWSPSLQTLPDHRNISLGKIHLDRAGPAPCFRAPRHKRTIPVPRSESRRTGITMASLRTFRNKRTFTNWLGQSDKSLVIELRLQLDRARGLIDLIVERQELAVCQLRLVVAAVGFAPRAALFSSVATTCPRDIFRQVKITAMGCTCVITSMPFASDSVNNIARIHQPQSDAPV